MPVFEGVIVGIKLIKNVVSRCQQYEYEWTQDQINLIESYEDLRQSFYSLMKFDVTKHLDEKLSYSPIELVPVGFKKYSCY